MLIGGEVESSGSGYDKWWGSYEYGNEHKISKRKIPNTFWLAEEL